MGMTPSPSNILALAEECQERLASPRLTPAAAKLYSQHTRLRFQQPGLANWTAGDATQRLDDAIRLIDAGLLLRSSNRATYRDCLRRAGELLEWLSHPGVGLGNPPVRLLSAATYLLAGYPARANALLRSAVDSPEESEVLRAYLRGDLPRAFSALTEWWALPGALELEAGPPAGDEVAWRSWVVGETLRGIGVACSGMRWDDEDRLPAGLEKLRAAATLMVHSGDRYSWLLAKLCAEVTAEYQTNSMRGLLRGFKERMSENGRTALERYCRLAYLNRKLLAWPSQQQGITRLVKGGSFALCTPTGSGKTTVAELAILQALFEGPGTRAIAAAPLALYLVPSRALAAEVETKLHGVLRRLTAERVIVTGLYGGTDWGPTDAWLTAEDRTVLICTYEKAEALMRFLGPLFLQRISLVVLDEAHSVRFEGRRELLRKAESRALRLEALGMRLFHLIGRGRCRIIALSAVALEIDDALQRWVSGDGTEAALRTTYRSTRQLIGRLECHSSRTFSIHYDLLDGASLEFGGQGAADTPFIPQPFPPHPPAPGWEGKGPEVRLRPPLLWAALNLAAPDDSGVRHGVLISITQRIGDYAEDFLTLLTDTWATVDLPPYFAQPQDAEQLRLWERCLRACEDYFSTDSSEYRLLVRGIVVHHGNMPALLGRLLVEVVQQGITTLVMATSTLSEGVNLPLETILVPSVLRGGQPMKAREFANLAGRAGRPGVGTEGRTLVLLPPSGEPDLPRKRYRELIRELVSATQEDIGSSVSPLSELLAEIWDGWQALSLSSDRQQFLHWLEVTAPRQYQQSTPDGALPAAVEALDTLDGVLLSAVVETEELSEVTTAEQQLQEIWQSSFAAIVQAREGQQEEFFRRGMAIRSRIYPEGGERRRLYRTGLPPCSAYQLLALYPTIREALAEGAAYASWTRAEKLVYIDRIVGLVGSIDRFHYPEKQNKQSFDWEHVLAWWLAPEEAHHRPNSRQRSAWFEYANRNFGYRFSWGLGSVIGLITDDLHGTQLLAFRLEDWPKTGLPWVVFWLKELITWGTLEPMAAYLLGRGLADTRRTAEIYAAEYAKDIAQSGASADPLDATSIRKWADEYVRESADPPISPAPRELSAEAVLDFSDQVRESWRVLPVPTPEALLWVDPAGYLLAQSPSREDWQSELHNTTDFHFHPNRGVVRSSVYF
jgi:hypothetical protein